MIKVAITDDHIMVMKGLQEAFDTHTDIRITAAYSNARELMLGLKNEVPDVLLLDLQLPDLNGRDLVPLLFQQHPDLRILILSSIEYPSCVKDMMRKGCRGYLFKSTASYDILVDAIKQIHNGDEFLEAEIREALLQDLLRADARFQSKPLLTSREKEVLRLIAAQYQNQQIADRLLISLSTVETHRYNLMQKLDVDSTAGLVREAIHYNF